MRLTNPSKLHAQPTPSPSNMYTANKWNPAKSVRPAVNSTSKVRLFHLPVPTVYRSSVLAAMADAPNRGP